MKKTSIKHELFSQGIPLKSPKNPYFGLRGGGIL
jgi:hypothetical protein